ncbi:MAG TPA: hypothetical protein VJ875_24830 [Pyrinomonadaceae bacterium]|nr:hypothetical protein [Pyrinomonadaceae bacterium]
MFTIRSFIKGTTATLLAVFGLMMIVWAHERSAPPQTRSGKDSLRAVKLRLTFGSGHWANVTAVEGGTIKVERDGKKLAITPYITDQSSGKVELRVFQAVQRNGGETMEAVDTLLVDNSLTKLNRGSLPLSVQVVDVNKKLPADFLATPAATCCARACDGTLVCGVCVCTDCGVCFTHGWCDCPPPPPPPGQ